MEIAQVFGITGALISVVVGWLPVKDVYQGRNHPQRSGWLIWLVLNCIFVASQWAEGARYSIAPLFITTAYMVAILPKIPSQGVGGFDRKDKLSLAVAAMGLALWAATSEPLYALLLSFVVDVAGTWLVVEKTYRLPWSETFFSWAAGIAAQGCAVLAVLFGDISFEILLIPVYFFTVTIIMTYIMHTRRKIVPNPELAKEAA